MDSSLVQEGYSDFILKPVAQSVWITVGDVSVYVRRQQGCVHVDLYPLGMEMEDPLCGVSTPIREATKRKQEYEHELKVDDNRRRAIADWPGLRHRQNGDEEGAEGGS